MDYLWLAVALAVGFVLGWVLSARRSTSEMARFEGRVEELQGRLVRAQRANDALLAEAASGQDYAPTPDGGRGQAAAALGKSADRPNEQRTDGALADDANEEGYEYVEVDELTEIRGIGQVLQEKLYDLGIFTYEQIVALTPDEISYIDRELKLRGRIARDDWVGQARRLLEGGQGQPGEPQSRLL